MKKIVRLTEKDLTNIIKKVIVENTTETRKLKLQNAILGLKGEKCQFNQKNYPNLYRLTKGSLKTVSGIVFAILGVAGSSTGLGSIAGGMMTLAGATSALNGMYNLTETDIKLIFPELSRLTNCIKSEGFFSTMF